MQWNVDWPLFLSRDARMYNRRCLHSSMIGMLCTASWGPSRAVQTALRCPLPESCALTPHWTGCRLCFVVDLVEEHVDLGGSRFFWTNSRTRELSTFFTTECGNPGIRKSMFTSLGIVCSWLDSSWFTKSCPVRSRSDSSSTLDLMLSWKERVMQPSGTFLCVFLQRVAPFMVSISWGRNVFLPSLRVSRVLRFIGFNNELPRSIVAFGHTTCIWNWLFRLGTSGLLHNFRLWSLSIFWTQFSFPVVFQGDLWWRPRWHAYFFVYDFSSFHQNTFRNTICWKCFMKNDCVRSSLIELQFFPQRKIDGDPIHCVLMSLPCFVHGLCMTRCIQVDRIRILMVFVHGIHKQEEYCLSFAQTLTSKY